MTDLQEAWDTMRAKGWRNYLVVRGWTVEYGTEEGDSIRIRYEPGQVRPFGPNQTPDLIKRGAVLPMEH